MPKSLAIGIDLGTASSALSRIDEIGRSAMIRNPQGDLLIPSIVYFEDDELVFGNAAKQAAAIAPGRAAEFAKRDLGQPSYSRAIADQLLPAELIEACLLKSLVSELVLPENSSAAVVVGLPGCFDQAQRRSVLDAAAIAGLDLLGTIDEPLAAALAFAENQGYLAAGSTKPRARVLVFDLGGGKLDVAIFDIKPGSVRELASGGQMRLGGREWDLRLADLLADQYTKRYGEDPRYDMVSVRRLLQTAEETKHTLSARAQVRVHVERSARAMDVAVSREDFEAAAQDLVERARKQVEQVLARASLAWRDLSHLLLVGGAARMPMIGQMLESLTGLKAVTSIHPDEAVARGAALVAEARLAQREGREPKLRFQIASLTPNSLGVEWVNPDDGHSENVVLIPRGTELPCGTVSKLTTHRDDQSSLAVRLLEGESPSAEECSRVAQVVIRDLPAGLSKGTSVEVHYQFNAEGRLQVKAVLAGSEKVLAIDVERERGLTENEVGQWKNLLGTQPGLTAILGQVSEHSPTAKNDFPATVPMAAMPSVLARPAVAVEDQEVEIKLVPMAPVRSVTVPPSLPAQPPPLDVVEVSPGRGATSAMRRRHRPQRTWMFALINVGGYIVFSVLGLVLGYYILMWLRPP